MKTKRTIKGIVAAALALSLFAVPVVSDTGSFGVPTAIEVSAATVEVNSEADLVSALINARDGDTIKVANNKVIMLTGPVATEKNITIDLTNAAISTANSFPSGSFMIGVTNGATVTINNGVLQNRKNETVMFVNNGATVKLSGTQITKPSTSDTAGIYVMLSGGKFVMDKGASMGGGISVSSYKSNKGTLTVNDSSAILGTVYCYSSSSAPATEVYFGDGAELSGNIEGANIASSKSLVSFHPNCSVVLPVNKEIVKRSPLETATANVCVAKISHNVSGKFFYTIGNKGIATMASVENLTDAFTIELFHTAPELTISVNGVTVINSTQKDVVVNGVTVKAGKSYVVGSSIGVQLPGDVNGDGKITAVDLVLTKRYVNQMITDISPAADMNGDGKVTTVDYVLLKRAYAKLV